MNIRFDIVPLYVFSLRGPFEGNKDLVAETDRSKRHWSNKPSEPYLSFQTDPQIPVCTAVEGSLLQLNLLASAFSPDGPLSN